MARLDGSARANISSADRDFIAHGHREAQSGVALPLDQPTAGYPRVWRWIAFIANILKSRIRCCQTPTPELTPAFYGCYDWHSAVHGHWMLARLARCFPNTSLSRACGARPQHLRRVNIAAVRYLKPAAPPGASLRIGLAFVIECRTARLQRRWRMSSSRWRPRRRKGWKSGCRNFHIQIAPASMPTRHSPWGLMMDWARSGLAARESAFCVPPCDLIMGTATA